MSTMEQNSVLNDYQLKQKRLCAELTITANATPANKEHGIPDVPGVMLLRTEGKTSDVDAIETVAFTTADDENTGNCVFGVMLRGGDEGLGSIRKVLSIRLEETSSSPLSTALAVTKHGTSGLTTDGNIAFSVAGTGLRLDTESPRILVTVDYLSDVD
jgi:hypothetical protein